MPAQTRLPPGLTPLFLDARALVSGVRRPARAGHVIGRNEGMLSCSAQATRPTAVVSGRPVRYREPQSPLHRRLQSSQIGDLRLRTCPVRLEALLAPEGFGPGPA